MSKAPVMTATLFLWFSFICSTACNRTVSITSWEHEGILFQYDEGSGVLAVSTSASMNVGGVVVPTTGDFAYLEVGGRKWGLSGEEFNPKDIVKLASRGHSDTVMLRPGMSLRYAVVSRSGADLTIEVDDNYSKEVQQYYRKLGVPLWTGRGTLR